MKRKYAFLSPLKVGNRELKNRIIYSAMGKNLAMRDGYVSDRYIEYFRRIAKGGVALITTGIMVIDPEWHYISDRQPWLSDDKFIPGLKRFVDAIHKEDCLVMFQPWQSGQAGQPTGGNTKPLTVNDLSMETIRKIQNQWVNAARRAKEAGADGIEFHLAHTYLPSQFLSPYFNKRTDEYGSDTVENAMRFSLEIIERIRDELVDEHFMISAKINGDDFIEGGTTIERTKEACKMLEKSGVVMITVNAGGVLTKVTGMSDNGVQPEGWKVPFAEEVKKVVGIPVAASGSLRHPAYVDEIISQGRCDLAAIGRGILAEPEWVKKASEGREDEMRYCISCMFCFTRTEEGVAGCSINPFAKREMEFTEPTKDGNGRKIVIIGAGPSGMEAAITLAERDFKVTVFEKEDHIGGLVNYAAMPPHKQKMQWMIEYYQKQAERLNVVIHYGVEATEEMVVAEKPYAIVVAVGSKEFVPTIKGISGDNVKNARQLFWQIRAEEITKEDFANRNVAVLGGGLTGVELAHLIQSMGGVVKVFELLPVPQSPSMEQKLAVAAATASGVEIYYENRVEEILVDRIRVTDLVTYKEKEHDVDLVVCAMGVRSEGSVVKGLKERYPEKVYVVGDSKQCGKISTAVSDGADIGRYIN